jgi:hypothetical protein
VPDPNSPIQLLGPTKVLGWDNGAVSLGYTVQNTSVKNVLQFHIKQTNWYGTEGYSQPAEVRPDRMFVPLMTYWMGHDDSKLEVLTLNEADALKLGFSKDRNRVWVVMVTKVKLADGTAYDVTPKFQELEKFLDNQRETAREDPLDVRIQKLRDFVSGLMQIPKKKIEDVN